MLCVMICVMACGVSLCLRHSLDPRFDAGPVGFQAYASCSASLCLRCCLNISRDLGHDMRHDMRRDVECKFVLALLFS